MPPDQNARAAGLRQRASNRTDCRGTAEQGNFLALNATMQAARASEPGSACSQALWPAQSPSSDNNHRKADAQAFSGNGSRRIGSTRPISSFSRSWSANAKDMFDMASNVVKLQPPAAGRDPVAANTANAGYKPVSTNDVQTATWLDGLRLQAVAISRETERTYALLDAALHALQAEPEIAHDQELRCKVAHHRQGIAEAKRRLQGSDTAADRGRSRCDSSPPPHVSPPRTDHPF